MFCILSASLKICLSHMICIARFTSQVYGISRSDLASVVFLLPDDIPHRWSTRHLCTSCLAHVVFSACVIVVVVFVVVVVVAVVVVFVIVSIIRL
jgi:hypothetical protein